MLKVGNLSLQNIGTQYRFNKFNRVAATVPPAHYFGLNRAEATYLHRQLAQAGLSPRILQNFGLKLFGASRPAGFLPVFQRTAMTRTYHAGKRKNRPEIVDDRDEEVIRTGNPRPLNRFKTQLTYSYLQAANLCRTQTPENLAILTYMGVPLVGKALVSTVGKAIPAVPFFISGVSSKWSENLVRIRNFVSDTVAMFSQEKDYSYGSMSFENLYTYKKTRFITMPIRGEGIKKKGFYWGKGRVEIKRYVDDNGKYLSFCDRGGQVRRFQWMEDGFEEIKEKKEVPPEYIENKVKLDAFISETLEMLRGDSEFQERKLDVAGAPLLSMQIVLPKRAYGKKKQMKITLPRGSFIIERIREGGEKYLIIAGENGNYTLKFKWYANYFIKSDTQDTWENSLAELEPFILDTIDMIAGDLEFKGSLTVNNPEKALRSFSVGFSKNEELILYKGNVTFERAIGEDGEKYLIIKGHNGQCKGVFTWQDDRFIRAKYFEPKRGQYKPLCDHDFEGR